MNEPYCNRLEPVETRKFAEAGILLEPGFSTLRPGFETKGHFKDRFSIRSMTGKKYKLSKKSAWSGWNQPPLRMVMKLCGRREPK